MSNKIIKIVEELETVSLLEASELIIALRHQFGVIASFNTPKNLGGTLVPTEETEESAKIIKIFEELKTVSLLEASELILALRHQFGVIASFNTPENLGGMATPLLATEEIEESAKILQLVEELKTLTLLEAAELVLQIQPTFDVILSFKTPLGGMATPPLATEETEESAKISKILEQFGTLTSLQASRLIVVTEQIFGVTADFDIPENFG